jgi:Protein of unknown function (DUF2949)
MTVLPRDTILSAELEAFDLDLDGSNAPLIRFLQEELALTPPSIAMALRYAKQDHGPLPMVLWQYGLVSLDQLNQILDWLEK